MAFQHGGVLPKTYGDKKQLKAQLATGTAISILVSRALLRVFATRLELLNGTTSSACQHVYAYTHGHCPLDSFTRRRLDPVAYIGIYVVRSRAHERARSARARGEFRRGDQGSELGSSPYPGDLKQPTEWPFRSDFISVPSLHRSKLCLIVPS